MYKLTCNLMRLKSIRDIMIYEMIILITEGITKSEWKTAFNLYHYYSKLIRSGGSRQVDRHGSPDQTSRVWPGDTSLSTSQVNQVTIITINIFRSNVIENFEINVLDDLFSIYLLKKNQVFYAYYQPWGSSWVKNHSKCVYG